MPTWSILIWLLIGAIAGLLARRILGGKAPFGTTGDIVLGVVGALVGGYGLALSGISATTGGIVGTLVAALIGSLVVLWVVGKLKS